MTKQLTSGAPVSRRTLVQTAALATAILPAVAKAEPQVPPAPAVPALGGGQPTSQLFWTVDTRSGKVMGMANGNVKEFKGIPYGAPTGGANRYLPPKAVKPWTGVRECLAHGQVSPQTLSNFDSQYGRLILWDQQVGGMGEDCLVLNLWTPSLDRGAKKAVMVCFHGGGWATGSGNAPGFDGGMMAHTNDVVTITINHRLNTLGYLNLADLGAPAEFQSSGVVGVMDMVAALQWVHDNVENFGGDPNRVMIFGQSGGGAKTSVMVANPAAKGLFHRAPAGQGRGCPQRRGAAEKAGHRQEEHRRHPEEVLAGNPPGRRFGLALSRRQVSRPPPL